MTRLVNDMRDTVAKAMIAHTFADEIAAIHRRTASLAVLIYNDVYTVAERKRMDELPEGWLPTDDDIFIKVEKGPGDQHDLSHRFRFDGNWITGGEAWRLKVRNVEPVYKRFTTRLNGQTVKVYDPSCHIGQQARKLLGDAKELHNKISDADLKLRATLDTFFTVEKLTDAWPEIAPFVPEPPKPVTPPPVPALPTKELNKLFKLPVSA